jgi:hypothetical protein
LLTWQNEAKLINLFKAGGSAGRNSSSRAGKVLTHKFLLGELWDDLTDAQYLRVYVRQLRQKIETDPERPHYILTETGIGYRLRRTATCHRSFP